MKFGIFYEHQIPRPWDERSEYRQFQQALEQIELADALGFDFAWCTEHHFMEEYSHASAPEVFLGAASQRTKNIRLGFGIVQLTTNHPARVAERISTLDLLSDGRVELGLGEAGSTTELHPFGRRFRDKRAVFDEAVQVLMPMFSSERGVEWHGEYFDFPLRTVLPKPLQKPHPPLWVACSQYETIARAGRLGMGALGFQFLSTQAAQAWVHAYYNAFVSEREPLADYEPNPNIAMVSALMCATSEEEARRRSEGWSFFQFALGFYNREGPFDPGTVNLWDRYLDWRKTPKGEKAVYSSGLIGTPDQILKQLDDFERAGVDQVILLNQAGKNTHEDIMESLELFGKEVMPEFHAREPAHQEWKRKVLSGKIQLEEIDTTPFTAATTQTPVDQAKGGSA